MTDSILIIEDEEHIARVLRLELEHEGYRVGTAFDGKEGVRLALEDRWSLILLDVMLPEWSGLEVLRQIRQVDNRVPVILLTARDDTPDIVSGFEQGANDYVTKPYAIEELQARIRNLINMTQHSVKPTGNVLEADGLQIDLTARKITRDGNNIELTPKEFDLLQYLIEHKGHVLSRDRILSDVWGYEFTGDTNIVDVYIRYLRQKIDQGYQPKLIKTVRGIGYELLEPET